MSQGPRRHLRLENVDGVTVVSFVESKIVTEENIQEVGDQLYSLVEDEGHKNLLLNFGNVQYLSSAALGKLINLKKKVAAVKAVLHDQQTERDGKGSWNAEQLERDLPNSWRTGIASQPFCPRQTRVRTLCAGDNGVRGGWPRGGW